MTLVLFSSVSKIKKKTNTHMQEKKVYNKQGDGGKFIDPRN